MAVVTARLILAKPIRGIGSRGKIRGYDRRLVIRANA
jgi:hypothetical protein